MRRILLIQASCWANGSLRNSLFHVLQDRGEVHARECAHATRRVPEGSRLLLRVPQDVDAILTTSPYFIRIEWRTKWDKYRKVEKIDDTLGVLP